MNVAQAIERSFRNRVVYPFLRAFFRNPTEDAPCDPTKIERILVFRYDRIGDMIVTMPVLRAIKHRSPDVQLAVLASAANAELAQNCPFVNEVFILQTNWLKLVRQILELRSRRFDVVMNFIFNRTTGPAILQNLIAPHGLKIGQGPDKYGFYFNRLIRLPRFECHMTEQLALFVGETFGIGITEDELRAQVELPAEQENLVRAWLRSNSLKRRSESEMASSPYVVFNLSAREPQRVLSEDQVTAVAGFLGRRDEFRTVVIVGPSDRRMQEVVKRRGEFKKCLVFSTHGPNPLLQLASLIGGAIVVISPDTSIIHFASLMQTPVAGIYGENYQGPEGEDYKGVEWGPFSVRRKLIRSKGDMFANTISPAELVKEIDGFLTELRGADK